MEGVPGNLNSLNKEEQLFSTKFFTFIHEKNIEDISEEFNLAFKHIERNGTDRIIFLDMALKLVKLLRKRVA
jgi:DNA polymerase-3 subunit delta'